jgi:chromosome segregation ATPase
VSADKKAGSHAKSAAHAGTEPDRPTKDEAEGLQQEIERTREHLGDTVQQLAAKAHVKTMARDKASELSERLQDKTEQVRMQSAARAQDVRSQLAGKTTAARHRAQSVSQERIAQVREQIAAVATQARDAAPGQVREAVGKGVSGARRHRVPLAVAAGVLVLGLIVVKRRRGR